MNHRLLVPALSDEGDSMMIVGLVVIAVNMLACIAMSMILLFMVR